MTGCLIFCIAALSSSSPVNTWSMDVTYLGYVSAAHSITIIHACTKAGNGMYTKFDLCQLIFLTLQCCLLATCIAVGYNGTRAVRMEVPTSTPHLPHCGSSDSRSIPFHQNSTVIISHLHFPCTTNQTTISLAKSSMLGPALTWCQWHNLQWVTRPDQNELARASGSWYEDCRSSPVGQQAMED